MLPLAERRAAAVSESAPLMDSLHERREPLEDDDLPPSTEAENANNRVVHQESHNDQLYMCDFAASAIDLVQQDRRFHPRRCTAFVHDVVTEQLPEHLRENKVDILLLLYVLSAIHPEQHAQVLAKAFQVRYHANGVDP